MSQPAPAPVETPPGVAPDARTAVHLLVQEALDRRASDIHIEPSVSGYDLNLRIDGLLETIRRVDADTGSGMVNRLMVAAKLLTYRRDVPQEGRYAFEAADSAKALDLRVSVMPTNHGLRVAVRLPADLLQPRGLDELGLPDAVMCGLEEYAAADGGMLLLTGPAGSGKTTTIYALLEMIRRVSPGVGIVALEDPVERDLPGVTQVQVTPFGELTYERALRSMLRQDPQVLALGEVRDAATASVAVQAALSGHRLVSTLHAASPSGALVRLLEMGLERYQVAGALWGVVSLRLLRRCASEGGYAGRFPVASLGRLSPDVRDALVRGATHTELEQALADQPGYIDLHDVAAQAVSRGLTDAEEVERVLGRR